MTTPTAISDLGPTVARLLAAAGINEPHPLLSKLDQGEDNTLYVTTVADQDLVVRVRRGLTDRYAVAAWASRTLSNARVPVARVLGVTEGVAVETRCPGGPLASARSTTARPAGKDVEVAVEAGRLLRRIHTVPVIGFGKLDLTGHGHGGTPHDWLVAHRIGHATDNDLTVLLTRVHQVIRHHAASLSGAPTRLLHGDWKAAHIIAADGEITGVVDLESARGGHPLADVAGWSLREHPALTDALIHGYASPDWDTATAVTLTLLRLRIAAALLRYHLDHQDTANAQLRVRQLRADLHDLTAGRPRTTPRATAHAPTLMPPASPVKGDR
ncbi:aminoglycoside phosphotransferase family protein [Solwaraspora sp. WMMD1047]|uniref:phosphotransferase family protein n=1 Tax=Solwaraspora sp. WMMD1047 TaxID=3016102 RepID=UPI0024165508|nr:aminoglycoside phosphotransferase family protein [Solwaraspora sp. WMMD1047]MDG4834870.1 aminoglycoside phosphotransferase family protein [Solwaraspora sp. WMMD1047]